MNEENSEATITKLFGKLSAIWGHDGGHNLVETLHSLLQQAQGEHLLGEDTVQMIERLLHIGETRVRDIMIPRGQILLIEEDWDIQKIFSTVLESGHSRYPVVNEAHEQVRGILLSKDLLPVLIEQRAIDNISALLRPATIVPESKPLDAMLREFRVNRNHMALVIDEYGNLSGLVTIEDVIEEIVGEIDDEHDEVEDSPISVASDGSYQIKALTPIEVFNHTFGTAFSDEDADTIGGYLQQKMGKMPQVGDFMILDGWKITVSKANQRRLISLHLAKAEQ